MTNEDMDKVLQEAKKSLTVEQMKDAVRKYSYGGKPVNMAQGGIHSKSVPTGDFGPDPEEIVIPLSELKLPTGEFSKAPPICRWSDDGGPEMVLPRKLKGGDKFG